MIPAEVVLVQTRKILMIPPTDMSEQLAPHPEINELRNVLSNLMVVSRDKCIREMEFLAQREDICAKFTDLFIGNIWPASAEDERIQLVVTTPTPSKCSVLFTSTTVHCWRSLPFDWTFWRWQTLCSIRLLSPRSCCSRG